jgi:AcrR family transcriptional regulator
MDVMHSTQALPAETTSLRQRKRLAAMARIQDRAFTQLRARGFAKTTITDIAAAAEVSPSTVYRYFGTKEGIFVWDPLEAPVMDTIVHLLDDLPPVAAIEQSLIRVLAELSEQDESALRERTRLVFSVPELRSSLRIQLERFEHELSDALSAAGTPPLEARVTAVTTTGTMWVAIDYWQRPENTEPLRVITEKALSATTLVSERRQSR